jgi:hypothetical protein
MAEEVTGSLLEHGLLADSRRRSNTRSRAKYTHIPYAPLFCLANALVQLQAHYHRCGEAASEKCLPAATFVRRRRTELITFQFIIADTGNAQTVGYPKEADEVC